MINEISNTLSSFNLLDKSHLLDLSTTNNNTPMAFSSNFSGGKKIKTKEKTKTIPKGGSKLKPTSGKKLKQKVK